MLHRHAIVPDRFDGVGAWRVRSKSSVFHEAEIAAAKMLFFFRESAAMDILAMLGVVS
jgi:hypothetical protein